MEQVEPLGVPAKVGFRMIPVGPTKGWELIKKGELETYKVGTATRIYVPSIKAYVARQLAKAKAQQPAKAA